MDKLNLINFSKYIITKDGKIVTKSFNKPNQDIEGSKDKNGYINVYLRCIDGKNKSRSFLFHRVIWFYFNGEIPKGYEINHKDEDKTNNALDNLELLTRKENVNYGTRNTRAAIKNSIVQKGKKLTKEHVEHLLAAGLQRSELVDRIDIQTGELLQTYDNAKLAAESLGVKSISNIRKACNGLHHQAYGYIWKSHNR